MKLAEGGEIMDRTGTTIGLARSVEHHGEPRPVAQQARQVTAGIIGGAAIVGFIVQAVIGLAVAGLGLYAIIRALTWL